MKRVLTVAIALLLCMSIALPLAANADIYNSPNNPEIKPEKAAMDGVDVVMNDCVTVTNLKAAEEKTTDITDEERELLIKVYNALVDGTETLPIEGEYAVRDIVDVSFKKLACRDDEAHGHKDEVLKQEGITLKVDFTLGVAADEVVETFVYVDGAWKAIVSTTNNGDGTVTCVFEDLCPVAFAVIG